MVINGKNYSSLKEWVIAQADNTPMWTIKEERKLTKEERDYIYSARTVKGEFGASARFQLRFTAGFKYVPLRGVGYPVGKRLNVRKLKLVTLVDTKTGREIEQIKADYLLKKWYLSSERSLYTTEREHIECIIPLWDESGSIAAIKLKDTTYQFKKSPLCKLQRPGNLWIFCNIDMESDTSTPLGEDLNLDNIRIRTISKEGESDVYRIYIKPADK